MKDNLEKSYKELLRSGSRKQRGEWIKNRYPEEGGGNALKGLIWAGAIGLAIVGFGYMVIWIIKHFVK